MVFAGALGAAVYAQQLLKRYDLENESEEYRERVETYIFKYGNIFLMMDMAFFVMLVFGRKFLFRFAMEAQPVEVMEVI